MKTHSRKLISFLLVAIMLFALSASAFADGGKAESKVKQFDNYCCFGDSVAYGIYYDDQPDTFPRIVGRAVGATDASGNAKEDLWYNRCGLRLKDMAAAIHAIDFGFEDPYITSGMGVDLHALASKAATGEFENYVKQADLITIQLGINDVLYGPFSQISPEAILGDSTTEEKISVIENFFADVAKGTLELKENYPKFLDRIKELKGDDDYTVVLVGIFNTNNMMEVSDDIPIPLGSAVSTLIVAANEVIKQVAEDYGYAYVDITNVPTGAMVDDYTIEDYFNSPDDNVLRAMETHPAYPEGYRFIARQILAQLPVEEVKPDTNVRVDLGTVTEVTSVTLGSVTLPKDRYSFDPDTHLLTIKNGTTFASSVTVIGKNSNNKLGLYVYYLKYDANQGYVPSLVYQNANMTKTAVTLLKTLGTITSTIAKTITGLFGK